MKKLPTILFILSILFALVEFVPGLKDVFYTIHRPFSAVFLGLFLVTHVMANETDAPGADHNSPSHGGTPRH